MIYELRTYTFNPVKINTYLDIARKVGCPARGQISGPNCVYCTSDFRSLNQIWPLWED